MTSSHDSFAASSLCFHSNSKSGSIHAGMTANQYLARAVQYPDERRSIRSRLRICKYDASHTRGAYVQIRQRNKGNHPHPGVVYKITAPFWRTRLWWWALAPARTWYRTFNDDSRVALSSFRVVAARGICHRATRCPRGRRTAKANNLVPVRPIYAACGGRGCSPRRTRAGRAAAGTAARHRRGCWLAPFSGARRVRPPRQRRVKHNAVPVSAIFYVAAGSILP